MMRLIIIILFSSLFSTALAQNYPVEVMISVDQPYSLHLSDYFRPDKVRFTLFMKDLNKINYPVILKISLTHQVRGMVVSNYQSFTEEPLYISAGESKVFSWYEFLNTFDQTALNHQEFLLEGYYSLCAEVIDWQTQLPVSQINCHDLFLSLDDAPFICFPEHNSLLEAHPSQNLNISWTHFTVNSAMEEIQYELSLFEKPDKAMSAVDIVNHILPVFRTTVYTQNILITESDLLLEPGNTYILMVQATSAFTTHLFKNSGYSELVEFTYGVSCPPPLSTIVATWGDRATIDWEANINHTAYHFNFKSGNELSWNSTILDQNHHEIDKLIKDTTYYYQIRPFCNSQPGEILEIDSFMIVKDEISFSCESIVASEAVTNEVPDQNLLIGDLITANGFNVQLGEINYHENKVSGEGFIIIPYLNDARVYVEFTDIKVNTDRQLFEGKININSIGSEFNERATRLADLLAKIDNYLDIARVCLLDTDDFDAYVNYIETQLIVDSSSMKTLEKQVINIKYARGMIQEAKSLIGNGDVDGGSAILKEAKEIIASAKEVTTQLFGTISQIGDLLALLKEKIIKKSDSLSNESSSLDTVITRNSDRYHQNTLEMKDAGQALDHQIIMIEHNKVEISEASQKQYLQDSRLKDPLQTYNQIMEDLNRRQLLLACMQQLLVFSQPGELKKIAAEFQNYLKTEIENFNWKKLDLQQLESNMNSFLDHKILHLIKVNPGSI